MDHAAEAEPESPDLGARRYSIYVLQLRFPDFRDHKPFKQSLCCQRMHQWVGTNLVVESGKVSGLGYELLI